MCADIQAQASVFF